MTDVGAMIRTHRKRMFKYRSDAAKLIMIDRGGGIRTHMSREGLRKLEENLNLPSAEVLNEIISKWGLDLAEAENLRRAVHVQHQRRAGYEEPTTINPLGNDIESLINTTIGAIVRDVSVVLESRGVDVKEISQDLFEIVEVHIKSSFR